MGEGEKECNIRSSRKVSRISLSPCSIGVDFRLLFLGTSVCVGHDNNAWWVSYVGSTPGGKPPKGYTCAAELIVDERYESA